MDAMLLDVFSMLASCLRLATPLIFAAMGGLIAERSGIVDIGLEGKMLVAAFAAAAAASATNSAWLGLLVGMAASVLFAMLHGFASIRYRGDQVVSGLALNFLASGLTVVVGHAWYGQGGQTPSLDVGQRFAPIHLPGADWAAAHIPVLGAFYKTVLSGHTILVYLALATVALVSILLYRTRFGLRLRAVGEEPNAVDTAGISVAKLRYGALALTGLLCGAAGAYHSIAHNAAFTKEMTAGGGYIAIAAVIFGKWRPVQTMGACLLFGMLTALEARLQGQSLPFIGEVPTQVFQVMPYVLTVILLAGLIGKATPPKAIGKPYLKER